MRKLTAWMTGDGTEYALVAARTKSEAARIMGRSLYSFNQFAADLADDHPDAVFAFEHPGTLFVCSNARPARDWVAIDRAWR